MFNHDSACKKCSQTYYYMTCPRYEVYDSDEPGYYHCIVRCVRRAFLCGFDRYLSKSFEHRRDWVRTRITELEKIFAIDCFGYAVMETHLHTGLNNRPDIARTWSDEEVARRWSKLFPKRRTMDGSAAELLPEELNAITSQPKLVELYRKRLSNISWFNRCLNENIARRANAEDNCKGRFWEGRFKCIRLEGTAAILACSVYIDLNPVRAGMAKTLEESNFTSIQDRILQVQEQATADRPRLIPISKLIFEDMSETRYIQLVEETGRMIIKGKQSIDPDLVPILERLGICGKNWSQNATSHTKLFRRIVGNVSALKARASIVGKSWFQGVTSAKQIFT